MTEFELIKKYFTNRQPPQPDIPLGIGDDCALMSPSAGMHTLISTDMLVEGRHFLKGADARMLGHKSLAVNLSDLAAMGAAPRAFTLALALPEVQEDWLRDFSHGLVELADQYQCQLIGGDTTKGPLNICITVLGECPFGQALRRDAAKEGDDLWVSGKLGDARLALAGYLKQLNLSEEHQQQAALRMHMPTPRIALGLALRGIAHAAIDISDGLIGDLNHILERSTTGATLWCDALPVGDVLRQQNVTVQREFALTGGDDYEICFTAASDQRSVVLAAAKQAGTEVTRIGFIEKNKGMRLLDANNHPLNLSLHSFDHFYESGN
jgi:thiamine-monophosphate kinase